MKTTVVGSFPVPDWLKRNPGVKIFRKARVWVLDLQERAGLDVIGDGELGRWDLQENAPGGMVERFIRPMEGVRSALGEGETATYRKLAETRYREKPPGIVVAPLGRGRLNLAAEWRQVRALTDKPLKFTVTSPYMLARVAADVYYRDLEALTMAFAEVLAVAVAEISAEVVQVDEPNLPGSPEHGLLAVRAINRVLEAASGEKAVHLCFGNYRGKTVQKGSYRNLVPSLNGLRCDHLVLETVRRPLEDLSTLREVRSEIKFGIGVIDVKDPRIEKEGEVARRIETLHALFGSERIAYVHPDCGLANLPMEAAEGKLRALVGGRNLFLKAS